VIDLAIYSPMVQEDAFNSEGCRPHVNKYVLPRETSGDALPPSPSQQQNFISTVR